MKIYLDLMSAIYRQTGLKAQEIKEKTVERKGECIYVSLLTDHQWYEIYLDTCSHELLGINTEPRTFDRYEARPIRPIFPSETA